MEIKIIGTPKEIADLVLGIQSQQTTIKAILIINGKEVNRVYAKIANELVNSIGSNFSSLKPVTSDVAIPTGINVKTIKKADFELDVYVKNLNEMKNIITSIEKQAHELAETIHKLEQLKLETAIS